MNINIARMFFLVICSFATLALLTTTTYATSHAQELTIQLQTELTRVGCNPGSIDGQWGRKGRRALAQFKRFANVTLPHKDVSREMVDTVARKRFRVCPKSAPAKIRQTKTVANPRTRKIHANKAKQPISAKKARYEECMKTGLSLGYEADAVAQYC